MKTAATVLLATLALDPATAQADRPSSWVSARLNLAVAGQVEVENSEDDLDLSAGGELLGHHRVHENLALFGGLSFLSWKGEQASGDRNTLVDLTVGPMGLLPAGERVTLFAAGRIGGTLSLIGDDEFPGGNVDNALGWHAGGRLGVRVSMTEEVGLEVDLGVMRHSATHEVDTILGSTDVDGQVTEVLLRLGLAWALPD